jgi:hypothetical protein
MSSDTLLAARNYENTVYGSRIQLLCCHRTSEENSHVTYVSLSGSTSSPNGRFALEEILEEKTARSRRRAKALCPPVPFQRNQQNQKASVSSMADEKQQVSVSSMADEKW